MSNQPDHHTAPALMALAMRQEALDARHAEVAEAFDRIGGTCSVAGLTRREGDRWQTCRCPDGKHGEQWLDGPEREASARQWVAHHQAMAAAGGTECEMHLVLTRQLLITTDPIEVP